MLTIGIDFSIQFPAACICKDFKELSWIACVNANTTKIYGKFLEDIESEYSNVRFVRLPARVKGQDTYSAIERSKLSNYSVLVDSFVDAIAAAVGSEDRVIVSIEGIAYGAKGNALVDICQSTGMMRKAMLDKILRGASEKLFIFSPGELKNAIGAKGNAGKFDVYQKFKSDPQIALNSDLHNIISMNEEIIVKGQDIKSPFMDMIDAYLAVLKIHESLKES